MVYRKVVAVAGPEVDVAPSARSLTEQVYDHLLELILNAQLRPGEMVLEPSLATYFGVSKTPVREALRMLTHDGWVVTIPRKGYLIKPLQLDDISEVFGLRMMIEPALFAEAARQATAETVAMLRHQVDRQADRSASLPDSLRAAREFHLRGAAVSRNRRARVVLDGLLHEIRRLHHLMPEVSGHISSAEEVKAHAAIVDAVERRDADAAAERMREHLIEVSQVMVAQFTGIHPV